MQPTFDELGIELLKYGYRKIVFIEIECKIDGTYRLGVGAEQPIWRSFRMPAVSRATALQLDPSHWIQQEASATRAGVLVWQRKFALHQ